MFDVEGEPVTYSTTGQLTPAQLRRINVRVKEIYGFPLTWQERAGEAWGKFVARVKRSIGG